MIEKILHYRNLQKASCKVLSNGGLSGVDGMGVKKFAEYVRTHYREVVSHNKEGVSLCSYQRSRDTQEQW